MDLSICDLDMATFTRVFSTPRRMNEMAGTYNPIGNFSSSYPQMINALIQRSRKICRKALGINFSAGDLASNSGLLASVIKSFIAFDELTNELDE